MFEADSNVLLGILREHQLLPAEQLADVEAESTRSGKSAAQSPHGHGHSDARADSQRRGATSGHGVDQHQGSGTVQGDVEAAPARTGPRLQRHSDQDGRQHAPHCCGRSLSTPASSRNCASFWTATFTSWSLIPTRSRRWSSNSTAKRGRSRWTTSFRRSRV